MVTWTNVDNCFWFHPALSPEAGSLILREFGWIGYGNSIGRGVVMAVRIRARHALVKADGEPIREAKRDNQIYKARAQEA